MNASDTAGRTAGTELDAAIERLMESAARMGVEIDRHEAEQWIGTMSSEAQGGEISVDVNTGVYGHRVTMLDYSAADLARFREMAKVVGFEDRPPTVMTALSLSGSAAQSKIQRFPGDCDFFERIHIKADTREAACQILADIIREKALATHGRARVTASSRSSSGRTSGRSCTTARR